MHDGILCTMAYKTVKGEHTQNVYEMACEPMWGGKRRLRPRGMANEKFSMFYANAFSQRAT